MKRFVSLSLILIFLLSSCAVPAEEKEDGYLAVHYLDVGQADCILLIADDTAVLIDGGNTDTSQYVLNYLRRYGVDELDLVVNTHPHGDHLGGIPTVLNNIPTEEVWCSTTYFTTYLFSDFKKAVEKNDTTIQRPAIGTVFSDDGLSIKVLGPMEEASAYEDLNDSSLVLMVEFGKRKFLFTGDMEAYAEKQLVNADVDLKADVLKVGHHGSYSSTSQIFLDKVDPDYGVITCGLNNEYGHPHRDPMSRLNSADVTLYRTDLMGNVIIMTNGDSLAFCLEYPPLPENCYPKRAA